jgi:hypothetical protein
MQLPLTEFSPDNENAEYSHSFRQPNVFTEHFNRSQYGNAARTQYGNNARTQYGNNAARTQYGNNARTQYGNNARTQYARSARVAQWYTPEPEPEPELQNQQQTKQQNEQIETKFAEKNTKKKFELAVDNIITQQYNLSDIETALNEFIRKRSNEFNELDVSKLHTLLIKYLKKNVTDEKHKKYINLLDEGFQRFSNR